jgi:hypothetical protein
MSKVLMDKKEAESWPIWGLIFWSIIFAVVLVPCLVVGYLDKANRGLFIMVAILVVPQMIALWVSTIYCIIKRNKG